MSDGQRISRRRCRDGGSEAKALPGFSGASGRGPTHAARLGRRASLGAIAGLDWSRAELERVRWAHNSLLDWTYALLALVGVWVLTRSVHALVEHRLDKVSKRTATQIDDVLVSVVRATSWVFHAALSLLVARNFLELSARAELVTRGLIVVALALQVGLWAQRATDGGVKIWAQRHEIAGGQSATMAAGIRFIARLLIWILVGLFVLSNLGVEVSAVLAGLGVGGIAAALALQSILGDLFAGLSMYFDRPFDIGDSIQVDQLRGTVEKIGLRTTRVRSLDGEQIVLPNGELGKARIRNFARLLERRVLFLFGVEYGISADKLERARDVVIEVLGKEELVRLERAHFKGFGPSSLDFEVVYFVLTPDYLVFMDLQQRINLQIYRTFENEGIPFAFPTQTLHLRTSGDDRDGARKRESQAGLKAST